jgi:hypothetical protein
MQNWRKIKGGASLPQGDWKRASPLLTVHGVLYRKPEALAFAKAALKLHDAEKPFGLIIEREPDNPHDPNALKIIGWGGGVSRHFGYVEAIEAARFAERYPGINLTAELYSVYLGGGSFVDIRYFIAVPAGARPVASGRIRSLLEYTRDELLVLCYAARADNKLGRLESEILNAYAAERARDHQISLVDEDVADIKRWCKEQAPDAHEVEAAIHRLADDENFSAAGLWELIEIVVGIDGKISKVEQAVAAQLASYLREATNTQTAPPSPRAD